MKYIIILSLDNTLFTGAYVKYIIILAKLTIFVRLNEYVNSFQCFWIFFGHF